MDISLARKLTRLGIGLALTTALCGFLPSCAADTASSGKAQQQKALSPINTPAPAIEKTNLYHKGESIPVSLAIPERSEAGSRDEGEVSYPRIERSIQLPNSITRDDFFIGALEVSSIASMQERLGFSFDENGDLPTGYSYALVTYKVKSHVGLPTSYDSGAPSFAILNDNEGHYTPVGTPEPLWRNDWNGQNAKKYSLFDLAPEQEIEVSVLYALSDEDLDDPNLIFVVDQGYGTGLEGLINVKAFDVTSQPQS